MGFIIAEVWKEGGGGSRSRVEQKVTQRCQVEDVVQVQGGDTSTPEPTAAWLNSTEVSKESMMGFNWCSVQEVGCGKRELKWVRRALSERWKDRLAVRIGHGIS